MQKTCAEQWQRPLVAGDLSAKKCILVAIQEFVQNEINLSFHVISSETLILLF